MRFPVRLTSQHPLRKIIAALLIAVVATMVGVFAHHIPNVSIAMSGLDNTLYDAFYRFREPESRVEGQIVIVTVDESSMDALAKSNKFFWPWPRLIWGALIQYMEAAGARAVVFDIIFKEPRAFDIEFGKAIDNAKIPVILGNSANRDGTFEAFAPKVTKRPMFGTVNTLDDKVTRRYLPSMNGQPSLAIRAVEAMGEPLPAWAREPFRLHYYGPNVRPDGQLTFNYLPAYRVAKAAMMPAQAKDVSISPEMFKGKVVVVGSTARAVYDVVSSPLSPVYPGVEVQATAIDNLLNNQYVKPVATLPAAGLTLLACLLTAMGVILPRKVMLKVMLAIVAAVLLVGIAERMFVAHEIRWLPMASPLFALLITIVGAFAWSYLTEDRQRRLVFKALSQYVSPDVAAEIQRNPDALKLGGERREMTVMFTDIQGFTDLSESMDSEKLSRMLNFYFGEMSGLVLANNGTLDKYIGDSIMSFWNAPIMQSDHAALACRSALAMKEREAQIQPELAALGATGMLTRLGINTGPMVFGNMGAPQKFNYSVLGDSVNLGSRLEGANKLYGSRILIADSTAQLVKNRFVMRKLDLLRVKGKLKPLAVYELLAEGQADGDLRIRIDGYDKGFAAYQAQKWDEAETALKELHERFPEDLPATALLKRIEKLRHDPPGADWDGVYVAKDK